MPTADADGRGTVRVAVLVRQNCPTCVRMTDVVRAVCDRAGEPWESIDVDAAGTDPEWRAEYADAVPVTLVDGREVGSGTLSPDALAEALGAPR